MHIVALCFIPPSTPACCTWTTSFPQLAQWYHHQHRVLKVLAFTDTVLTYRTYTQKRVVNTHYMYRLMSGMYITHSIVSHLAFKGNGTCMQLIQMAYFPITMFLKCPYQCIVAGLLQSPLIPNLHMYVRKYVLSPATSDIYSNFIIRIYRHTHTHNIYIVNELTFLIPMQHWATE